MIKVIVFDFAGVISPPGPIKQWIKNNLSQDDKRALLFKEESHQWDTGKLNLGEVYAVLSEITGTPAEKIWTTYFEKQLLNIGIRELITALKKNYKVFLFSNHYGELLRKLLLKHHITDLFDEIIISSDHKVKKPEFEFFEIMIKKTGVKKDEVVFTDDEIENIDAAKQFGIKAILFQNCEQLVTDLKKQGVKI